MASGAGLEGNDCARIAESKSVMSGASISDFMRALSTLLSARLSWKLGCRFDIHAHVTGAKPRSEDTRWRVVAIRGLANVCFKCMSGLLLAVRPILSTN